LEFYGKKHILVGEIEEWLGYKMRVSRDLVNDSNFYLRKMATEIEDGWDLVRILEREAESHQLLTQESQAFLTKVFGNPGWMRLVEARWLKQRQIEHQNDYDPCEVPPVFVLREGGHKEKPSTAAGVALHHKDQVVEFDLPEDHEVEDPQGVLQGDLFGDPI
jgi:hypothetical protein